MNTMAGVSPTTTPDWRAAGAKRYGRCGWVFRSPLRSPFWMLTVGKIEWATETFWRVGICDTERDGMPVESHHARHQAREHARLLAPLGAWCELTGSGFGVWVPAERWPARVRVTLYDDARTTREGTLLGVTVAFPTCTVPYRVQMDLLGDPMEAEWASINPRDFDPDYVVFLSPLQHPFVILCERCQGLAYLGGDERDRECSDCGGTGLRPDDGTPIAAGWDRTA